MQDDKILDTKRKITSILKIKGPSLPVQVAREIQLSSLFAGALLSELAKEKLIKISHMKVGGSPLYFLAGQEVLLEKFHTYLPGKEKEAFLLLKKKGILEDKKQAPPIRVALRNLRDFAFPFSQNNEIFWQFHTANKQETTIKPKKPTPKTKKQNKLSIEPEKEIKTEAPKENPVKKQKERPEFVTRIINSLRNNNIEILEEKETKKKEFLGIVRIDSTLGKIKFLCIAKDKKTITESDLRLIVQKTQTLKIPALVIFTQNINKKALSYAETCPILKLKRLG